MNPFRSARVKLTAFYFAILVVFCLVLTFGVRAFTDYELNRGDDARRGAVQQLFQRYNSSYDNIPNSGFPGTQYFVNTQEQQADVTRQNLNRDFFLINLVLLTVGAVLSYWYAGRTLKPIEEAHEQQKRFTSDASHELRTPLASMKLENEIFLRQKGFSEAEARELISSNLEEVNRLERLATNLLALSNYEYGDDVPHEPMAVKALVEDALAQVKRTKEARKVTFNQDVTPAIVDVNRPSLVQMLSILLDNAVKYGPSNGTVEITGKLENETYIIGVRDHGPGLTEEDLPHIFERMYRGDKARSSKVSGHGIGLSLAKQIAEVNEATLEAGNHPEGGAQFTLTLR